MWEYLRAIADALSGRGERARPSAQMEAVEERWRQHIPAAAGSLKAAADLLLAVMADPALGGPGYLTVQFPTGEPPTVTAQFPNIGGILHRRILRRDLSPAGLAAAGFPAALLAYRPRFAAESGSMVLMTVRVQALPPALARAAENREERERILAALAEELGRLLPDLGVRSLGGELLLTPVRYRLSAP